MMLSDQKYTFNNIGRRIDSSVRSGSNTKLYSETKTFSQFSHPENNEGYQNEFGFLKKLGNTIIRSV